MILVSEIISRFGYVLSIFSKAIIRFVPIFMYANEAGGSTGSISR